MTLYTHQMMSREQTLSSPRFKSKIQLDKNPTFMPCGCYLRKWTVLWMLTQWGTSIGCWESESLRKQSEWCCLFSSTSYHPSLHPHTNARERAHAGVALNSFIERHLLAVYCMNMFYTPVLYSAFDYFNRHPSFVTFNYSHNEAYMNWFTVNSDLLRL